MEQKNEDNTWNQYVDVSIPERDSVDLERLRLPSKCSGKLLFQSLKGIQLIWNGREDCAKDLEKVLVSIPERDSVDLEQQASRRLTIFSFQSAVARYSPIIAS